MLTKELQEWLEKYNLLVAEMAANGFQPSPKTARDGFLSLTNGLVTQRPDIAQVVDDFVENGDYRIPVRIYNPSPDQPLPLLVYLHGGGHMAGSVEVYDPIYKKIALAAGRIILAPDYRLAPEYPYPAGINDAVCVLENVDNLFSKHKIKYTGRFALGGDSAGGAMSSTIAQRFQDSEVVDIEKLVLIYPSLDYTLSLDSVNNLGQGYFLEKKRIEWYFSQYFQNSEDLRSVSPLFMKITENFPSTFIGVAEFCPLRDEGLKFAELVKRCGVSAVVKDYPGVLHAFLNMEDLAVESCEKLYHDIADFLSHPSL